MQRLFHIPSGADHAVEIDPARLAEVRGDGWVWLDVVGFETPELLEVGRSFSLDRYALEEVVRDPSFPTAEGYAAYTFIVSHSLAPDASELRLIEVNAFIGADFLVTLIEEDLPGLEWARDHVQAADGLTGIGPDRFFARLAEVSASRFHPVIRALDDQILALEKAAEDGHPSVPGDVQALRRDVVALRRGVAPQREVFSGLERGTYPFVGERARLRLGAVHDSYTLLTEEVDNARQLLAGVLDTYRSAVAEKANEVMKVLTVFAAIVLPLSLMAGIYGMNFSNMPELDWRWGYFGLLGAMTVVALSLWIYFSRRGFIGGPRLSTIPRGVGRGLSGIVGLTVKPTLKLLHLIPRDHGAEPPTS